MFLLLILFLWVGGSLESVGFSKPSGFEGGFFYRLTPLPSMAKRICKYDVHVGCMTKGEGAGPFVGNALLRPWMAL